MNSDSKILEDKLKKEFFLSLNKEYSYKEIIEFAEKVEGYTPGKVNGILNRLIEKSFLIRLERGKYKLSYNSNNSQKDIRKFVLNNLDKAINNINDKLSNIIKSNKLDDLNKTEYNDFLSSMELLKNLNKIRNEFNDVIKVSKS